MKKLCFLSLSVLLLAGTAVASPRFVSKRGHAATIERKLPQANAIWRPASQTEYEYFVENGKWYELGTVHFQYDSRGNCVRESYTDEGVEMLTVSEYNDDNLPTFRLTQTNDGSGWKDESKTSYEYDPIVRGYYTLRMGYNWFNDAWVENYRCESNTITRDAAGNITDIVKAVPLAGEMLASTRMEWSYDETTGRASEYAYYCNYGEPVKWILDNKTSYKDLEWEETDGQLVKQNLKEYVAAPNRLKSASVLYDNVFDGYIFISYTDNGYTVAETTTDPTAVGISTTVATNPYAEDSSWSETVTTYNEYFDATGLLTSQPVYQQIGTVVTDQHGNIRIERVVQAIEGEAELMDEIHYDYTYDSNGCPTELLVSYFDFEANQFVAQMRIVYHDYIDAAGVSAPWLDPADAPVEYFNLQGQPVATPAPGRYIRRQGPKSSKVLVK